MTELYAARVRQARRDSRPPAVAQRSTTDHRAAGPHAEGARLAYERRVRARSDCAVARFGGAIPVLALLLSSCYLSHSMPDAGAAHDAPPSDAGPLCTVCDEPPASVCMDDGTLRVFAPAGACEAGRCTYAFDDRACPRCPSCDLCAGVRCESPPPPQCIDAHTLRSYAATGACADGRCAYASNDAACAAGCADGACLPPVEPRLAAGISHTCLLRETGRVSCWGSDARGQLGDGASTALPMPPTEVVGLTDAVRIAAGGEHTCAVRAGGALACWGRNDRGQLGDGTTVDRAVPADVPGLSDVVGVSLAPYHTCARTASGAVLCWGSNEWGMLGDGTLIQRNSPVAVLDLTDAIHVAASYTHTCAVRAGGSAVCWGEGSIGLLGTGNGHWSQSPVAVVELSDAISLAGGMAHTCALRAGGAVACWGANGYGQLGYGGMSNLSVPTNVASLSDARLVTAGAVHTCALRRDGRVWCWGALASLSSSEPLFVPSEIDGVSNAIGLASGDYHACALVADGSVRCWGANRQGQLGDGTTTDRRAPTLVIGL